MINIAVDPIEMTREYLMMMRQALLMQLDAIERLLAISPRTAELRKEAKKADNLTQIETKL